jgi:methanogenic corrinoid protein MtbC1/DNA-binding transcriptional ArsR family regulator
MDKEEINGCIGSIGFPYEYNTLRIGRVEWHRGTHCLALLCKTLLPARVPFCRAHHREGEYSMKQHRDPDALSQALAEPSRRAILENLRLGRKSVGELVAATDLKQPNVSNHLARMREQGIVRSERLGRHVYYSIALPVAELLLRLHESRVDPLTAFEPHESIASSLDSTNGASRHRVSAPASDPLKTEMEPTVEAWREAYFHTIMAGHEDRANALVNELLAHRIDMETIYFDVFEWAMERIGDLYARGETDEAHEHMASATTERMMGRVAQFYTPITRKAYRALFGAVAGNWHSLGLRMLSDGLRTQGWETLFLGANVPTASLVAMATAESPDLVVVSCMLEEQLDELKRLLHELQTARAEHADLHYRIVAGGRFLRQNPQIIRELPVDFSAATLHDFLVSVNQFYSAVAPAKK